MIASRLKFLYLDLDHQNFLITKGNFQITGPSFFNRMLGGSNRKPGLKNGEG